MARLSFFVTKTHAMRYLLFLILFPSVIFAQKTYRLSDTNMQIDSVTGGMIYSEVVQVPGATADQLYGRAKSFLVKAFTNESAVTQLDNKEEGVVGGRGKLSMALNMGQMMLTGQTNMSYEMAVEIRVKDGRYRYEFSNIEIVNGPTRIKIDDQLRKNPKAARKAVEKEYSQKEYDRYMGDKNPVQLTIKQLKQTMGNSAKSKNDF